MPLNSAKHSISKIGSNQLRPWVSNLESSVPKVTLNAGPSAGTVVKEAFGMVEVNQQMYLAEAKITAMNYSNNDIV